MEGESEHLITVSYWHNTLTATSWATKNLLEWLTAPSNRGKQNEGKQGWCEGIPTAFTHGCILVGGSLCTTRLKRESNLWRGIKGGESCSAQIQWNNHSWENIWGEIFAKDCLRLAWFTWLGWHWEETSSAWKLRTAGQLPVTGNITSCLLGTKGGVV